MLTIEVEFLHGTFRGSSADVALTGLDDPGEWPPSPARLVSAFVAADGTRERCRVTDGSDLRFLETQGPPTIHADPSTDVSQQSLQPRFVVVDGTYTTKSKGKPATTATVQEYVGRTNSPARPGTRMAPRHSIVAYVWESAAPDDDTLTALRRRAARIGYLGCADSPVRVRVTNGPPTESVPTAQWVPSADGEATVPIAFDGLVDVLDEIYDQFTEKPPGVKFWAPRRSSFRTELGRYREPGAALASYRVSGTAAWLRFDKPIAGRKVLRVTETLRSAVMDLYQRHVAGEGGSLPSALTGHGFEGRGYDHVSWVALPDVGYERSRGRIHGAAIVIPEDAPEEVIAGIRTAAWQLRELVDPGVFAVGVHLDDGAQRPLASTPRRWTRPSRLFSSAFPVVHERFSKRGPTLSDVAQWCEHAGLPAPIRFATHREPRLAGAVSLHPNEVSRRDDRYPYSHLDLLFERPVSGPVVLGRGRRFGLGLLVPIREGEPDV